MLARDMKPERLYKLKTGETVVFSRIGGTGRMIVHPPEEPDMQSSLAIEPSEEVVEVIAERNGGWMVTVSGRQFWPLDPRPEEVHIEDIAHALGNICRFGGHVKRFYSVAQHCVLVAACVPKEDQRWALLHDAAEAYMGDMVRPIKRFMPNFKEAEDVLLRVIGDRFGLTWPMPDSVHVADNLVLGSEARDLMPALCEYERRETAPKELKVDPLSPELARDVYLDTFQRLFRGKL